MRKDSSVGFQCSCLALVVAFNALLGGWSVETILAWFGKSIPFGWDMVIGFFTAEISVPVAVVGAILKHFGVF